MKRALFLAIALSVASIAVASPAFAAWSGTLEYQQVPLDDTSQWPSNCTIIAIGPGGNSVYSLCDGITTDTERICRTTVPGGSQRCAEIPRGDDYCPAAGSLVCGG